MLVLKEYRRMRGFDSVICEVIAVIGRLHTLRTAAAFAHHQLFNLCYGKRFVAVALLQLLAEALHRLKYRGHVRHTWICGNGNQSTQGKIVAS